MICPVVQEKFYWHGRLEHFTGCLQWQETFPKRATAASSVIHRGRLLRWVGTRLPVNLAIKGSQLLPSSAGRRAATYKITHTHIDQTPQQHRVNTQLHKHKSVVKNQLFVLSHLISSLHQLIHASPPPLCLIPAAARCFGIANNLPSLPDRSDTLTGPFALILLGHETDERISREGVAEYH